MSMKPRPVRAIFLREFRTYFLNPLGYIFIALFIALTGVVVYFQGDLLFSDRPSFFIMNEASLSILIDWFPAIAAIFIPLITMSVWADERRQGTEELLFTMPASDLQIVLGKYLGVLAIYCSALFFHLIVNLAILSILGTPDPALLLSNYLGFLLLGAFLLAVGMVASSLTSYPVVAAILGIIACWLLTSMNPDTVFSGFGGLVIIGLLIYLILRTTTGSTALSLGITLPVLALALGLWIAWGVNAPESDGYSNFNAFFGNIGASTYFNDLAVGLIHLNTIVYFIAGTFLMLYINSITIARRNW